MPNTALTTAKPTGHRRAASLLLALLVLVGVAPAALAPPQAQAATVLGQRIADIISAEVGSTESPLGSNRVPGKAYGDLGDSWCAHFVTWALQSAGVSASASGRGSFNVNVARAWSVYGKTNGYGRMGTAHNAQVGDLLIDRYNGSAGSGGHIGIVTRTGVNGSQRYVETVSGNESDRVNRAIKNLDDSSRYLVTIAEIKSGANPTPPGGTVSPTTATPHETYEAPAGWSTQSIPTITALDSGVGVASQRAGWLDTFYVDTNRDLRQAYYRGSGSWAGGKNFGKPTNGSTGRPTATSWQDGRLDVFVRTGSGAVAQRYFTGGAWSAWAYPRTGPAGTSPAVTSWGPRRLDLFSVNSGRLAHASFDGTTWRSFRVDGRPLPSGVTLSGAPAAASWDTGRIDVVAHDTNGNLWTTYYNGTWGPWRNQTADTALRAAAGDSVGLSSWGPGRLDVFVKATNGYTYHQWYSASAWSGFQNLATSSPNGPSAASWSAGRVDLFYRTSSNRLGHDYFTR